MSRPLWTSDYHLNHENIIKLCHRPFETVEQMNETIIRNHNERVKDDDTVFDLGDFLFRNSPGGKKGEGLPTKAEYYLAKLNGNRVKIKGNHDGNNSLKTIIEKVTARFGGVRICMVHNPAHADPSYEFNFVGHVHTQWKFKKLTEKSYMINVGVDQWNFRPVTFDEIMKEYRAWRKAQDGKKATAF